MSNTENLDQYLTSLISEQTGVAPDKINSEYIRRWREEHIYPDTIFAPRHPGLVSYSRNQMKQMGLLVDEILENI